MARRSCEIRVACVEKGFTLRISRKPVARESQKDVRHCRVHKSGSDRWKSDRVVGKFFQTAGARANNAVKTFPINHLKGQTKQFSSQSIFRQVDFGPRKHFLGKRAPVYRSRFHFPWNKDVFTGVFSRWMLIFLLACTRPPLVPM